MRARPRLLRSSVLVAAAALALPGLPLLAGGAAVAASGTLTYHCTAGSTSYDLGAVLDTNAPASLVVEQAASLVTTSVVTLPDSITASLRSAGATNVSGTSQIAEVVNGSARTLNQTITKTAVPPTGALHVSSSGPGGTIRGVTAGTSVVIGAGAVSLAITGYDDVGTVKYATLVLTCQLPSAGQDTLVDSVSVLPIPTTTSLEVRVSPIEYGMAAKVVVKVTKSGTTAKPDGMIALTTNGATVSTAVQNGRAVTSLPVALKMGSNTVSGVFTPTDKNVAPSTGSVSYSVVRGTSTSTTLLTFRDARHKLVGTTLVTAVNGTGVSGQVRFTLLRDGAMIRSATVPVSRNARARAAFEGIQKPGTYLLRTKYLGSSTLRRSSTQVKLRINDPNAFGRARV
ncbi:MAG: hypothetical protein ABIO16_03685 [Nocardioides sp.]